MIFQLLHDVFIRIEECHADFHLAGPIGIPLSSAQTVSRERLKEVTEHGKYAIPFELKLIQHIFSKTQKSGNQRVYPSQ